MGIKPWASGFFSLTVVALIALVVGEASAKVEGHFESEVEHTTIVGVEHEASNLILKEEGAGGTEIICRNFDPHGTGTLKKSSELNIVPVLTECATKGIETPNIVIDLKECRLIFYSQSTQKHGTVTVGCPVGQVITLTHPNCTITIPEQHSGSSLKEGVAYETVVQNGKHALTADITIKEMTVHFHNGVCVFLGTSRKFGLTDTLTVMGFDTSGKQVGITST